MSSRSAPKEKKKEGFKIGPFEQAIAILVVMGFAVNPSISFNPFLPTSLYPGGPSQQSVPGSLTNLPLFSPPLVVLVLVAYLGYYLLQRQSANRDRERALVKASASSSASSASKSLSSSSSSSSKPLSSSDIRSKGMPPPSSSSSKKPGDPSPRQVSGGKSIDPRKDPASSAFKKNYFLTMQGPGRPALVPFQDGLRPKKGEAEGTMWWDNVPDDAKGLMAPPIDAAKQKEMAALMKNPWAAEMIKNDIEMLKIAKAHKEEEERYEKVASILQSLLGLLLCAVDMRLGVVSIVFFLWKHFTNLQAKDEADEKSWVDKEKKELQAKMKAAMKTASDTDRRTLQAEMQRLERL